MVSLVVVDYNSIDKTLEYIEHVNNNISNCVSLHSLIVDNYPDSKARDHLMSIYKEYEVLDAYGYEVIRFKSEAIEFFYVKSGANLGYAKGNNLGINICNELFNDKYSIVSNNDLIFKTKMNWSDVEHIYDSDKDICVLGPAIFGLDNDPQSPNRRVKPFATLIYNYLAFKPFKKIRDLDYTGESKYCFRVSGCFMILKNELFIKAGMFDPNTFMYCEEMILSERLNAIGAKVFFWNDFTLIHNHGSTVKKNTSAINAEKWMYESFVYYFKTYRNTSGFTRAISKACFKLFVFRRTLKYKLKKH